MVRLRSAGWLIAIPPLGLGLRFLDAADLISLSGNFATDFLRAQFAFWDSGIPSEIRPRLALNLVLFLAASIAWLVVIAGGRARTFVIVIAAAHAFVAFIGLAWDFTDRKSLPPDFILHTIPVSWGRYTSFFYLACALTALGLALSDTGNRRIETVQPF